MSEMEQTTEHEEDGVERRDFLFIAAGGFGAVAAGAAVWPLVDQMNPSADVLALSSVEVDLAPIAVGQSIKVNWRGKPVFIRRRTAEEIAEAREVIVADLPDAQTDVERVKEGKDEWLVVVGVCTHLGCIPIDYSGDYYGWYCPCHGSHYDTSGRIRRGPAPTNLEVPEYTFLSDSRIKIG
jgi:ubiquinol-cytochrome c reductase iron-sulfur subunit